MMSIQLGKGFCYLNFNLLYLKEVIKVVQVPVHNNNADQALKKLRRQMQKEGVYRTLKLKRHYESPSERKKRELAECVRRIRKLERKKRLEDM